jgi:hypothetical protein
VDLHAAPAVLRRRPVPQQVDEAFSRHDVTSLQQQDSEQAPLLPARDGDRFVIGADIDRSEQAEAHPHTISVASKDQRP